VLRLSLKKAELSSLAEEAAVWFLRIQDDEVSQEDFAHWREWLSRSPAHTQAFDAVATFWRDSGTVSELPWPNEKDLARDVYDGAQPICRSAEKTNRVSFLSRRWALGGIAAALVLIIAGVIISAFLSSFYKIDSPTYETATGENRTIELVDGSQITLGAMSRITVDYSDKRRAVILDYGESFFEVAKDHARPFLVTAGPRTVRAVGTAFNVKMGVKDVTVTVIEGQVQVGSQALNNPQKIDSALQPLMLKQVQARVSVGESIQYRTTGIMGKVHAVNTEMAISWRKGRLAFTNESLESVIADVNRYSRSKIMIGDAMAKQLMFTGTVFQDGIEEWLEGLEKVFPVRVMKAGGHVVIIITRYDS